MVARGFERIGQAGEQALDIARTAVLTAGWPGWRGPPIAA